MPIQVLLIDNDPFDLSRLAREFGQLVEKVLVADGLDQALEQVRTHLPSHCVLEPGVEPQCGLDSIGNLRSAHPLMHILVLTSRASIPHAVDAIRRGAVDYLQKPATAQQIIDAFRRSEQPPLTGLTGPMAQDLIDNVAAEHLKHALRASGMNISRAARGLGIHRRTLQRQILRKASKARC